MPGKFIRVIDNATGRKLGHSVPESFTRHFNLRPAKNTEERDTAPLTGAEAPPSTILDDGTVIVDPAEAPPTTTTRGKRNS